jgi:hypothetical protein
MAELWMDIEEFPDYAVSNFGRVINRNTDHIKIQSPNQQGIPSVLLMRDRQQHRRSVALLVAQHFVPPKQPHFDTPINIDGDRFNNHWENIDWRPRWFAVQYHSQFRKPPPYGFKAAVFCVQDQRTFEDAFQAAAYYGVLIKEIILSTHTQQPVFPTWQVFGVLSNGE